MISGADADEKKFPSMFSKTSLPRSLSGIPATMVRVRLLVIAQLGDETNIGRDFDHIGNARNVGASSSS